MARFRGTVKGHRGEASRLGHAAGGLMVKANTWSGSISVYLFVRSGTDEDWAQVSHVSPSGNLTSLYHGPVKEFRDPRGTRIAIITDKEIEHVE